MTSDHNPPAPDGHVTEELAALVSGELDIETTRHVTGHLRACSECRAELVEVAVGIGLMRRLDALSGATERPAAASKPGRRKRSVVTALAAAALIVLVVGVVGVALGVTDSGKARPDATATLVPVSDASARGSIAMRRAGSGQAMEVDTTLDAAPPNRYYEVWLLDRSSGKLLPVGVLPPDGRGTYTLPSEILAGYDSVDISLQPNDGSTEHSSDSVLRAEYS